MRRGQRCGRGCSALTFTWHGTAQDTRSKLLLFSRFWEMRRAEIRLSRPPAHCSRDQPKKPRSHLPKGCHMVSTRRADGALGDGSRASLNLEIYRDLAQMTAHQNGSNCTEHDGSELSKPKITSTCQRGDKRWPFEFWEGLNSRSQVTCCLTKPSARISVDQLPTKMSH